MKRSLMMYALASALGVLMTPRATSGSTLVNAPSALAFVRLHNSDNSGFTRNSEFVIQDPAEFTRRWRGVQQGSPGAVLPLVDFEKTTVVFVAIGTRNTGGYAVRVDSVTTASGKAPGGATVHYTVTSPRARCMSMQMLTSPLEVISFDRVAGEIKFKKRKVSAGC